MPAAKDLFERELKTRGIAFRGPDAKGLYEVTTKQGSLTVNLENVARNYERDKEPESIARFVTTILQPFELPAWAKAKAHVFFSAESAENEFGEALRSKVSPSLCRVLVVTDAKEQTISFLTPDMLAQWKVSQQQAEAAARENLSVLLRDKRLEVQEIDGMKLGMVPVDSVFKASTIFSPAFKGFVSPELSWPVLVVIPCRDFMFVLPKKDKALLNRMGKVVQKEYRGSGYPLTTEVLEVSDDGVTAIGAFPP